MKLSLNLDVIKKIAEKQLWTINTGRVDKNGKTLKKPLNIRRLFGEEIKREDNTKYDNPLAHHPYDCCCYNLIELYEKFEKHTKGIPPNVVFWLNSLQDNIVVADIEPNASEEVKKYFLEMDYLYGERSLSKKGYHLIFKAPDAYNPRFMGHVQKPVLKDDEISVEILQQHWVTFTGDIIPKNNNPTKDFYEYYESLTKKVDSYNDSDFVKEIKDKPIEKEKIPRYKDLKYILDNIAQYQKEPEDFAETGEIDQSRFDFGACSYYYHQAIHSLKQLNVSYTDEQLASAVFYKVKEYLTENYDRDKYHSHVINGKEYLYYAIVNLISQNKKEGKT